MSDISSLALSRRPVPPRSLARRKKTRDDKFGRIYSRTRIEGRDKITLNEEKDVMPGKNGSAVGRRWRLNIMYRSAACWILNLPKNYATVELREKVDYGRC